jgi:glycine/D-amino acid oxidase-like deaminating enzyme
LGTFLGAFDSLKQLSLFTKASAQQQIFIFLNVQFALIEQVLYEAAAETVPALGNVPVQSMVNGPESFTPDMHYLLGPTPEVHK